MVKRKTKPPSIRDEYPDHPMNHGYPFVSQRAGNKVRWESYGSREAAEAVAAWAKVEAEIRMRQGYDAGYCSPGSITETADGLYEVCIL